ncbi:Ppx/GppA phosphatase family protein [Tepidicaulis sp. LMO-SS28]|uniref:Ppx/GppA phosphatase family protein n=1 Tax=Tepidicaulis sp. LMO-SS28 TaxID=3447455 RepID=UPI003EE1DEF8
MNVHQAGEPGPEGEARPVESPAAAAPRPGSVPDKVQDVSGSKEEGLRKRKRRRKRRRAAAAPADLDARPRAPQASRQGAKENEAESAVYGALDLGTNNCRLLIARRGRNGFRVIDAFSRIVRLGEGLAHTGELSQDAMDRALEALKICADKMKRRGVTRARTIATEACRKAANGAAFIERVERETGLILDVVTPEDEARLAVSGCAPLIDPKSGSALVFDIGGGSTELIWVRRSTRGRAVIEDWTSLPCGVVTLAEHFGGVDVTDGIYNSMVGHVTEHLDEFRGRERPSEQTENGFHLLGTSGTVTTIAGVQMGLKRYDRNKVDGAWVDPRSVGGVTRGLLAMNFEERAAHACVGRERADLVLAGCAILEAILNAWPADRLRVADRGLREGILFSLMSEDMPKRKRKRRRRRRARHKAAPQTQAEAKGE